MTHHRELGPQVSRAVRAVRHILFGPLSIEANVLVNMVEFIGREIIMQFRIFQKGSNGKLVFDQLLVPRSWAFDAVKRPPLPRQGGVVLRDFVATLYKILELLRGYKIGVSPLYAFNGGLGLLVRSILILRICRLIVLVANNVSIPLPAREEIREAISRSLTGTGDIHTILCSRFVRAGSWHELWNAVRYSPLNRGADELVYLSLRRDGYSPPNQISVKSIVFNNVASLELLLSLVELAMPAPSALDPDAQPYTLAAQSNAILGTEEKMIELDILEVERNNSGFPDLVISDNNFPLEPQEEPQCSLTALDTESGKNILFCYRRYTLRHRIKIRRAVKTIWAYYLRYRLRHKAPMAVTEEQIRKLHRDYKHDVELSHSFFVHTKTSQSHEHILFGCMPHVLVYLRGLECINQQQKQVIKKELQKVRHEELDKLAKRMGACTNLAKKIKASIQRISPGSNVLHQIDSLREEVTQVDSLRSEIMRIFGKDIISKSLEENYDLSVPVILSTLSNSITKTFKSSKPEPGLDASDLGI